MPVQINELIIRTVVDPTPSGQRGLQSLDHDSGGSEPSAHDLTEIVQTCVREVLRILAAQKER